FCGAICAPGGIRTHTGWCLRPLPLPLGYRGAEGTLPDPLRSRGVEVRRERSFAPSHNLSGVNDTSTQHATTHRVVIAEDEALIRMDLAEMLTEEGYDVVGQAADGERAVALAEELRPDLVICDVKM